MDLLRFFSKLFLLLILISISVSCKNNKKDVECNNARICVRNTSATHYIPYRWEGSNASGVFEDTLAPGECAYKDGFRVLIKHNMFGDETSRDVQTIGFNCNGSVSYYEVDACEKEFAADCYGLDLKGKCNNGVFDPATGESDVDCGGHCDTKCDLPNPCVETVNLFRPGYFMGEEQSVSEGNGTIGTDRVNLDFWISFGKSIRLTLYEDSLPTTSRKFVVNSKRHGIIATYNSSHTTEWQADSGQFFYLMKMDHDKWEVDFCNVSFRANYAFGQHSDTALASGRLSFKASDLR